MKYYPGAIWSLEEMLGAWGYIYLSIGSALAYVEVDLENHRRETGGEVAGHGTSTIDPDHLVARFLLSKCEEILGMSQEILQELGPIPGNMELLRAKFITARRQKPHNLAIYTNDIIDDVRRIKNDFLLLLSNRQFYYLRPELARYYGRVELFGNEFIQKFKRARDDVEHAGNCLALGEGTGCVMHLMRALEIVVRQLGTRLNVTINPKDTWGLILKNMDRGIEALPEQNEKQKRKKAQWSECRANLWHVKQAWRDESLHAKRSYSNEDARQILDRVREFAAHLATL